MNWTLDTVFNRFSKKNGFVRGNNLFKRMDLQKKLKLKLILFALKLIFLPVYSFVLK